jgi:hypothetical protein
MVGDTLVERIGDLLQQRAAKCQILRIELVDVDGGILCAAEVEPLGPAAVVADHYDIAAAELMLEIDRVLLHIARPAVLIGEVDDAAGTGRETETVALRQ